MFVSWTCSWNSVFPPSFPSHGSAHEVPRFPPAGPAGRGSPPSPDMRCCTYRRYYQDTTTPCLASLRLIVSPAGTMPPCVSVFAAALPPLRSAPAAGRGLCCSRAFPQRLLSHGQDRASQVPWRTIPQLCIRSWTPADPDAPRLSRRARCCPRSLKDEGVSIDDFEAR